MSQLTELAQIDAGTPAAPEIVLERRGAALWATLSRPQAYNAITPRSVSELDRALAAVEADATIRALVITGSGPAFCAGADLKAVLAARGSSSDENASAFSDFLRNVGRLFDRLERLPVLTIASVNGVALAGGLEMLLCCDIAVAAQEAKLGDGHANFGQLPGGGGSVRLPRRVGWARARYLMLTGASISAARAEAWGLVQDVVSDAQLHAASQALAELAESKSPLVVARTKQLLRTSEESAIATALEAELSMSDWHAASHDRNEGLAAFAQKRKPVYLGR